MALKTFNIDPIIYKEFSKHCKKEGISMSKRVEKYMQRELERIKLRTSSLPNSSPIKKEAVDNSFSKYC